MGRIVCMGVVVALTALGGCGGDDEDAPSGPDVVAAPEPVAPIEVATPGAEVDAPAVEGSTAEAPSELEQLRARVTELETQLAACQTGTVPEGVDVPATGEGATEQAAAPGDDDEPRTARSERERRDPSLLGTILGDEDGERRNRDDRVIQVPNPASILLGE